jgi:hypothetical protein
LGSEAVEVGKAYSKTEELINDVITSFENFAEYKIS